MDFKIGRNRISEFASINGIGIFLIRCQHRYRLGMNTLIELGTILGIDGRDIICDKLLESWRRSDIRVHSFA